MIIHLITHNFKIIYQYKNLEMLVKFTNVQQIFYLNIKFFGTK